MTRESSNARVARSGHPFLYAVATSLGLLSLLIPAGETPATAKSVYRLAGIVSVGRDHLGFLELPDGTQLLVRQGSSIPDGGRVVALDGTHLRIAFPGRIVELGLEASGQPGIPPATRGVVLAQSDDAHAMVRNVDAGALETAVAASRRTASPAATTGGRIDPAADLGRRFAALINIPPNARVLAVNEMPVTSVDRALRLIESSLAEGTPVRLNLAGVSGDPDTRVYLLPTWD